MFYDENEPIKRDPRGSKSKYPWRTMVIGGYFPWSGTLDDAIVKTKAASRKFNRVFEPREINGRLFIFRTV